MSLKTFLMKKMLASKMKGIPMDHQEKIFTAIEKNPQLFKNIAIEVQEKVRLGKNEMDAAMEVMQKYQADLRKIM